jgi:hypothetical protein
MDRPGTKPIMPPARTAAPVARNWRRDVLDDTGLQHGQPASCSSLGSVSSIFLVIFFSFDNKTAGHECIQAADAFSA